MIEALEKRRLMSATFSDGLLTVQGTESADVISVTTNGTDIVVNDDGAISTFTPNGAFRVLVNAAGGDDSVDLSGISAPATIHGGAGNDTLIGGSASDSIAGGDGNDSISGKAGDDTVGGGTGDDTVGGGMGNDQLFGGLGNDVLLGGSQANGADTLI